MRSALRWLVAFAFTLGVGLWQRLTGPTWPVSGSLRLSTGTVISYHLPRSAPTGEPLRVAVRLEEGTAVGRLRWKRFPSREPWRYLSLREEGGQLVAALPHLPAAGKLAYQFLLQSEGGTGEEVAVPGKAVVLRFKNPVPTGLLLAHVVAMFVAVLFALRAGLALVFRETNPRQWAWPTLAALVVGGLVLGPLVQKAAFGALWTGFPFGRDLTDNKTLLMVLAWAWPALRRNAGRRAVGAALLVTLLVLAIPHSLFGSELRWEAEEGL
ncbi:MAG: hypothetical protein N2447_07060 [Thermoanaerobaculum sp.]|nr:hypothetical protein [Thermoanaerobaculum sp.]